MRLNEVESVYITYIVQIRHPPAISVTNYIHASFEMQMSAHTERLVARK